MHIRGEGCGREGGMMNEAPMSNDGSDGYASLGVASALIHTTDDTKIAMM